jgi:hypothetical protein
LLSDLTFGLLTGGAHPSRVALWQDDIAVLIDAMRLGATRTFGQPVKSFAQFFTDWLCGKSPRIIEHSLECSCGNPGGKQPELRAHPNSTLAMTHGMM